MQPGTGHLPIPLDSSAREAQLSGDFLKRKTGEEVKLHYIRLARIEFRQFPECLVDCEHIHHSFSGSGEALVQRDLHGAGSSMKESNDVAAVVIHLPSRYTGIPEVFRSIVSSFLPP
jgi:hypothetical protein